MKRTFEISATGSGFGGRIASVRMNVEFDVDNEPLEAFYDKAHSAIFMAGYNVLHWHGVNGLEAGRCVYVAAKHERLAKRLLRDLAQYKVFSDMKAAIEKSEKSGVETENTHFYEGAWRYGGWCKESIERELAMYKNRIGVTHLVLEEMGYDPDDREGVRKVCHNLGFDRVTF